MGVPWSRVLGLQWLEVPREGVMDADHCELLTIGDLSRRTGLAVRTIRYWSPGCRLDSPQSAPYGQTQTNQNTAADSADDFLP